MVFNVKNDRASLFVSKLIQNRQFWNFDCEMSLEAFFLSKKPVREKRTGSFKMSQKPSFVRRYFVLCSTFSWTCHFHKSNGLTAIYKRSPDDVRRRLHKCQKTTAPTFKIPTIHSTRSVWIIAPPGEGYCGGTIATVRRHRVTSNTYSVFAGG